jgi:hypothetical protein
MKVSAGKGGTITRAYSRHWTRVHLDIDVDDIDDGRRKAGSEAESIIR